MGSRFDYLTRTVVPDVPDAPAGGGFRGFLTRLGTGARQGATPNTPLQFAARAMNPVAGTAGAALTEGFRDAVTGSNWYQRLFGGDYGNNNPSSPPGSALPSYLGQGMAPRPVQTQYGGVDADGNLIVPRFNWEEGYGQGDGEKLPYGEGQGMGRGAGSKPAQNYQGNRGATGGQVVARRIEGDTANNRALESMAEGLLGQDAVSRMNASSRQSIDMMNRMFGNKFK